MRAVANVFLRDLTAMETAHNEKHSTEVGVHVLITDVCFELGMSRVMSASGRWIYGRDTREYVRGLVRDLPDWLRKHLTPLLGP